MRYNIKSNNILKKKIGLSLLLLSFGIIIHMFISSISYQNKKIEINLNHEFSKSWILNRNNLEEEIDLPYINKNSNKAIITKTIPDKYLSNPTILIGASQ